MSASPSTLTRFSPVTQVVATGIGAALFVVVGLIRIPTPVPNTYFFFPFAILAVFAVLYGPVVGLLSGLIGHIVLDAVSGGLWLSWEIATGVFGLILGLALLRNKVHEGRFSGRDVGLFVMAVFGAQVVAYLLVAPIGDILIYSEPANKVFVQGITSVVLNTLVAGILGGIILAVYARTRTSTGSLRTED
jgi:energy-coupling factor transport system substrate-specific component